MEQVMNDISREEVDNLMPILIPILILFIYFLGTLLYKIIRKWR